jgi:hypothetical protein
MSLYSDVLASDIGEARQSSADVAATADGRNAARRASAIAVVRLTMVGSILLPTW